MAVVHKSSSNNEAHQGSWRRRLFLWRLVKQALIYLLGHLLDTQAAWSRSRLAPWHQPGLWSCSRSNRLHAYNSRASYCQWLLQLVEGQAYAAYTSAFAARYFSWTLQQTPATASQQNSSQIAKLVVTRDLFAVRQLAINIWQWVQAGGSCLHCGHTSLLITTMQEGNVSHVSQEQVLSFSSAPNTKSQVKASRLI